MRHRREDGFTLIELAVSLGVFAVAMIGLSLMFDQALESASRVRFDEAARTIAQRQVEEMRALPFYVPQNPENAGDVDLLDFYFPNHVNDTSPACPAGVYDPTVDAWTFTCTVDPVNEDGRDFRLQVVSQFVAVQDSGGVVAKPPDSDYDSDAAGVDEPPTRAVQVTVIVSRSVGGQDRSVTLDTVIVEGGQELPTVEASGSIEGVNVSGVIFQDGDGAGSLAAEVLASVGKAETAFREVNLSTSQASADPLSATERDSATGIPVGDPPRVDLPTQGQSSVSVPNSTFGDFQADSTGMPPPPMSSLQDPILPIASWLPGPSDASAEARVSKLHSLTPEGLATATVDEFQLNARDENEAVPLSMLELGRVAATVEQQSTTTQTTVEAVMDLSTLSGGCEEPERPAVAVRASRDFASNPNYHGVVVMESMHLEADATAGTTTAATGVSWRVDCLRVWDPNLVNPGDPENPLGDYGPSYTFGFILGCGPWIDDPATCGPLVPANPVVVPAAYASGGETALDIVVGITVQDSVPGGAGGASTASLAQKNVLFITTRDDLVGPTVPELEPMLVGFGNANLSVSYIDHAH
jgi:prepilin-type N-terminal cleavage/methylation domain-containing protein